MRTLPNIVKYKHTDGTLGVGIVLPYDETTPGPRLLKYFLPDTAHPGGGLEGFAAATHLASGEPLQNGTYQE